MNVNNQTNIESLIGKVLLSTNYNITYSAMVTAIEEMTKNAFPEHSIEIILYEVMNEHYFTPIVGTGEVFFRDNQSCIAKSIVGTDIISINKNLFTSNKQEKYQSLVSIQLKDKNTFGLLVIGFLCHPVSEEILEGYSNDLVKLTPLFEKARMNEQREVEMLRNQLLLSVTKKFHSSMDVGEILKEVVLALEEAYSGFDVVLYLTREWEVHQNLPIKQLKYSINDESGKAEVAYLTGQIEIVTNGVGLPVIYAPLRGKQGSYGVLELKTSPDFVTYDFELEFIELLADIGGNALENTELYQQSRNLIEDLQLINQTSHQLNANLRLSDSINFMTNQILLSFNAEEVGFVMYQSNGEIVVMEGSTSYFFFPETIHEITKVCDKVKQEKESLFIGDIQKEKQYSLGGFRSLLAVPMIQSGKLKGMAIVLHSSPYHFTFDHFKLLQSLIYHSTLAFTNSMLHEELEKLVITDHLTKLYSRNFLDERIQTSMLHDAGGSFLLFDIDNFKKINDTYGHQVGDDIIIQVANIMKKSIRETDIAARWGGEELAIYLPNIKPEIGVMAAERIVRAVSKETSPMVTVSCGISSWSTGKDDSLKKLFNLADEGLYEAKRTGKNKAVLQEIL
ncbi:sensor domain-containing diguanylate cyclase [Bacillus alkalicellulosilyticus]|uniref:sensor domain-containing diguanylate cyclase n=1 Tax=Alkalihalobacterium alkalicellulosilyticum TaxID=1912214 RepID=UPI0009988880|nr:sensor domain-containing diguanylate cyclase [Bacillus alkalicellulosilyticus]